MKNNKNAIFSLFIIILFIGSIVAAGILYYNPDTNQNTPGETSDLPQTSFFTELEGTVEEIFPSFIVIGAPTVYEETIIENTLREIDGITSINVSFTNLEEDIMAIVHISYDKDKEEIYSKINELEIFDEISVFKNALLEISKEITFINNDTNETKDYFHPPGKVEAYVSYNTEKEDQITANIFAVFQGNALVHMVGEELQNQSLSQEFIFDQKTYPLDSWNDLIVLTAETNIRNNIDINMLKEEFVEDNLEINIIDDLEITTDQNVTEIEEDIKKIQEEQESVTNIDLENNVSFMFEENLTLEKYLLILEDISTIIEDFEIIKEPKQSITINFNKENIDVEEITTKLNNYNVEIKNIQKSANIKITDTTFNEKEYSYEQETTEAMLDYPNDTNKSEFLFDVSGIVQRDDMLYLGLRKAEEIIEENIEVEDYTE
jgi:hypothetical protein